jgi:hypothetical protein
MKTRLFASLQALFKDRTLLALMMLIVLLGISYIIYTALTLRPSDLQVATHYSAFGDTHYYRNSWYYMITFVVFGIAMIGTHLALIVKLLNNNLRGLSVAFAYFSLFLLVIAVIYTHSVLGIAFLP